MDTAILQTRQNRPRILFSCTGGKKSFFSMLLLPVGWVAVHAEGDCRSVQKSLTAIVRLGGCDFTELSVRVGIFAQLGCGNGEVC